MGLGIHPTPRGLPTSGPDRSDPAGLSLCRGWTRRLVAAQWAPWPRVISSSPVPQGWGTIRREMRPCRENLKHTRPRLSRP